jgi:hypothetical protein
LPQAQLASAGRVTDIVAATAVPQTIAHHNTLIETKRHGRSNGSIAPPNRLKRYLLLDAIDRIDDTGRRTVLDRPVPIIVSEGTASFP